MGLTETMLFYVVIGLAVTAAVWAAGTERPIGQRFFHAAMAVIFWPFYLPILLTPARTSEPPQAPSAALPADELAAKIAEVERELDAAFSSLDGWAEEALASERDRFVELRAAWNSQANRVREMDALLAGSHVSAELGDDGDAPIDRIHQSERARRDNFARLHQVRDQAYEDLTASLARVRELVSLIHLAKFTGAPASRAEQLVLEIAASVEGLSEVAAWRDLPAPQSETAEDASGALNVSPDPQLPKSQHQVA